jgi:diguanylate cyclase (GGDEF)-like protein
MRQKVIDFRTLLEQVLPLEDLPPTDRLRIRRTLQAGIADQLEDAARYALSRLEESGAMRRLPVRGDAPARQLRWQTRNGMEVVTLPAPVPIGREGVTSAPRAGLPLVAETRLDHLRRLLRLDEALLASDPRSGQARRALLEALDQAGRDLLGASEVRFIPVIEGHGSAEPLSAALAAEARAHPEVLLHCPDTERCPALTAEGRRRQVRSVVIAAAATPAGETLGLIEVLAREPERFPADALAMVALLADSCAGVLERAARIEKLVFIDPLTMVYNRSYFDLQLRNEMARARREDESMALCIADIDDFKSFNSAFGYEAGDRVLVQVAQALRNGVRPFDTVARWGGEEFAVLLTAPVRAHDVVAVSERLRAVVERLGLELESLDRQQHRVGVTMSIGVALFPDHGTTGEDLWRSANQALLRAKRPPKNRVVFYTPAHHGG